MANKVEVSGVCTSTLKVLTEKEKTDFFDYLADSKTGTFDLLSIKARQALVDNISAIEHQTYKSIPLSNLSKEEKQNAGELSGKIIFPNKIYEI